MEVVVEDMARREEEKEDTREDIMVAHQNQDLGARDDRREDTMTVHQVLDLAEKRDLEKAVIIRRVVIEEMKLTLMEVVVNKKAMVDNKVGDMVVTIPMEAVVTMIVSPSSLLFQMSSSSAVG